MLSRRVFAVNSVEIDKVCFSAEGTSPSGVESVYQVSERKRNSSRMEPHVEAGKAIPAKKKGGQHAIHGGDNKEFRIKGEGVRRVR